MQKNDLSRLAYLYGKPTLTGLFKQTPEDFRVNEYLGFTPSGEGEHVFLHIEKTQLTTEQVAKDLARTLALPLRDIAYSGLKDKHAITQQWFSVPWPIKQEFPAIQGESWHVIEQARHGKKLRRGVHQSNHFTIALRDLQGDLSAVDARLTQIKQQGFANYFGEQRFGFAQQNIDKALALFAGELRCKPFQRSIYYSAARSYLFNEYLSLRIANNAFFTPLAGDVFNLAGSNSTFHAEIDESIQARLEQGDIFIAAPMFGQESKLSEQALALWQQVADDNPLLVQGLQAARLETIFRPLAVKAENLSWQIHDKDCHLSFELRRGAFATALIRELAMVSYE